jgi:hypothetical protein
MPRGPSIVYGGSGRSSKQSTRTNYTHGDVHTNCGGNAWSPFKRGLVGMYHHVSAELLQDYLDEFAFRYSHRREKGRMMDLVLAGC